ncbi:hypothetical protein [Burkholderia sp. IMCC1007]|uniref:hypothetical protein n=1 Tax=Burkholderia sp. IMCC1007 TaxID=3004104 RepID=UPI0022B58B71|nr:hypothetical protein [Burkholderia sp. IMCC1007]
MTRSPFTAVYDACVLYPAPLRDFLMWLAHEITDRSYGIEAQHPDVFVDNLFDLQPAAVVAAARRQRETLKHPPLGVDRYLEILQRSGMVQTCKALEAYRAIL